MRFPIFDERFPTVRSYCDDLNVPILKFFICGAKLLQLPAAEGSHESSECGENHEFTTEIRKPDILSAHILKSEIRGKRIRK
jgi:hypothetical protein